MGGADGSDVVLAAGGGVRAGGGVESGCKSVKVKIYRKIALILLAGYQDNCYICNVINERVTTDKSRCREKKGNNPTNLTIMTFTLVIKIWKVRTLTITVRFF